MEITDVRFREINSNGKLKAIVSVTFDDELVVHDIKIIEHEDRMFLAMPSVRISNGTFRDITHPITAGMRKKLQDEVLDRYAVYLKESANANENELESEDESETNHGTCELSKDSTDEE